MFSISRASEQRFSPHPRSSALRSAALLDLPFPSSVQVFVCEGALFHNRLWADGYVVKLSCGHPRPLPSSGVAVVDRDLALAYDAAHVAFQHDMITGLSHGALFAEWVAEQPARRALLSHRVGAEIFRASLGASSLDRGTLPKLFWAPSLRYNRAPHDQEMDGCEPFPLGSFWPVELFLAKIMVAPAFVAPAKPVVLYLSRGHSKNSIRWLDNEDVLVARLDAFVKERNWALQVVPHETTGAGAQNTGRRLMAQFYGAAAVVGLHGGAMSNIVFCNLDAVIVEINNNVKARDCFANIAVSRGMQYHRVQPQREFQYQSGDHFSLFDREIRQILALLHFGITDKLIKPDI